MISTEPLANSEAPYDVILISGDYWADHPHCGIAMIARSLESHGYSVGIIEKPAWQSIESFRRLGLPRLFFGISFRCNRQYAGQLYTTQKVAF